MILWIYIVSGIILFAMSIIMLIAMVRIWQMLSEIIASGAIPDVLKYRARRKAKEILRVGYIDNLQKIEELRPFLTNREDAQLLSQLDELKKQIANPGLGDKASKE